MHQAAYDRLLFREALKVAGYDLANARDVYRWVCVGGAALVCVWGVLCCKCVCGGGALCVCCFVVLCVGLVCVRERD